MCKGSQEGAPGVVGRQRQTALSWGPARKVASSLPTRQRVNMCRVRGSGPLSLFRAKGEASPLALRCHELTDFRLWCGRRKKLGTAAWNWKRMMTLRKSNQGPESQPVPLKKSCNWRLPAEEH